MDGHPDEEPVEFQLVRVEDRWIPADVASQWPQVVASARERMQSMTPEEVAGIAMQVSIGLGVAEGIVEQIAAIESVEEFDAAMGAMLESVMGTVTAMMPTEE